MLCLSAASAAINALKQLYLFIYRLILYILKSIKTVPGGPPSKYYPGPTMLNFGNATTIFFLARYCHMWNLTILKVEICLTKVEICFNGILRIGRFRTTFIFSDNVSFNFPKDCLIQLQVMLI